MPVPYAFANASAVIPLSQLDSNFNTPIVLGNTSIQLGNTVTALNNLTLANVNITSGTVSGVTVNAAGSNTQVQYNNNGSLAGSANLVFDGSNLGLGVTPSAWGSAYKALTVSGQGSSFVALTSSPYTWVGSNWYNDGSTDRYVVSNSAALYRVALGSHAWFNAPSGTSGNAITFTQAMTLDSSGNLGIGTTSPAFRTDVINNSTYQLRVAANTSNYANGGIYLGASGTSDPYYYGAVSWNQSDITMRLTANCGNNSGGMAFYMSGSTAAPTERMRLDTSGNLLVGTTSANSSRLSVDQSAASSRAIFGINSNSSSTSDGILYAYCSTARGTGYNFIRCQNTTAIDFQVLGNGNVQNTNNSYGAISDANLKENVVDATPKLSQLNQVRVVNYNFIGDTQKQIGVIAQELEQIFPGMVEETPNRDEEGKDLGTTTKSVKYSVFVPMLVKAIQEQQALIQLLTDRVAQLEAK